MAAVGLDGFHKGKGLATSRVYGVGWLREPPRQVVLSVLCRALRGAQPAFISPQTPPPGHFRSHTLSATNCPPKVTLIDTQVLQTTWHGTGHRVY